MRRRIWSLLGWGTLVACAYISGNLLWGAIRLPWLTGSGAAQADLGLYLAARHFGLPVTFISLIVLAAVVIARARRGLPWAVYGHRTFLALGLFNIIVAPGVMAWVLWGYQ
jgi:hypothetical protein